MMKVPFFDKRILRQFFGVMAQLSIFASIVFLFIDIDSRYRTGIGIAFLALFVALYLAIWLYANKYQSIILKINTSEIFLQNKQT
ncbi:MAG: hypothetical protein FWG65_08485 [Turicibacter sp.]|nr:hypothetical protein [Turicibacter sp.]